MTTITALIKRHPLPAYYMLTFALSWGGILMVVGGPRGLLGTTGQSELLMAIALSMMVGPSVSGLLLTGVVSGPAGLRDLLARLLRWRVSARWYAIALLTAPLLATAIFFVLPHDFSEFPIVTTNNKASLLLTAIATGLTGGFLEEVGWTGFAIPRLKRDHGVFKTGLIAGVLWGAWHFLVSLWYSGAHSGELPLAVFLALYFLTGVAQLTAYRWLMVLVYDRTESLLLAVLMHAILIVSSTPILLPAMSGAAFLTWFGVLTVALWAVVATVAVSNSREPVRHDSRAAA